MIETIESRWTVAIEQYMASAAAAGSTDINLLLVAEHPSLWPFFLYPPRGQMFVPPSGWAPEPKVLVRVNHSSWQTQCPFCPSAQHASKTDRWFFCADCLNTEIGNLAIPVVWPDDAGEIEQLLLERTFVTTRNWEFPETTSDLRAENRLYVNKQKKKK